MKMAAKEHADDDKKMEQWNERRNQ